MMSLLPKRRAWAFTNKLLKENSLVLIQQEVQACEQSAASKDRQDKIRTSPVATNTCHLSEHKGRDRSPYLKAKCFCGKSLQVKAGVSSAETFMHVHQTCLKHEH
jgi:hypothetical protein